MWGWQCWEAVGVQRTTGVSLVPCSTHTQTSRNHQTPVSQHCSPLSHQSCNTHHTCAGPKSGMQELSSHTPASSPPPPLPSSHTCQKKNMDSTNKQESAECNRLWKRWRQVVRVTEKSRRWRAACWHGGSVGCVHREAWPHVTQSEWSHHHSFLSSSSHSFYNQPQQPVLR